MAFITLLYIPHSAFHPGPPVHIHFASRSGPLAMNLPPPCLRDVFARVRSVLSNCETSRCGEEIVIVAPGADLLSIASAMLRGDDLRTHFKNKPPPGAVVHFGDMAATAKPWTPSKSNDPGPAWAAAERDRRDGERALAGQQAGDAQDAARDAEEGAPTLRAAWDDLSPAGAGELIAADMHPACS